jgi:hypothetical protein
VLTVCFKERKEGGKGCSGDGQCPFKLCGGGEGVEEGGWAVGGVHAVGRTWRRLWGTGTAVG